MIDLLIILWYYIGIDVSSPIILVIWVGVCQCHFVYKINRLLMLWLVRKFLIIFWYYIGIDVSSPILLTKWVGVCQCNFVYKIDILLMF